MRFMQPAPARETLALSRLACKLCTATSDMPFDVAALLGRFLPRLGPLTPRGRPLFCSERSQTARESEGTGLQRYIRALL